PPTGNGREGEAGLSSGTAGDEERTPESGTGKRGRGPRPAPRRQGPGRGSSGPLRQPQEVVDDRPIRRLAAELPVAALDHRVLDRVAAAEGPGLQQPFGFWWCRAAPFRATRCLHTGRARGAPRPSTFGGSRYGGQR